MALDLNNRLTPSGEARRQAMLGELIAAMESHHRTRAVRRNIAVLSAAALLVAGAAYFVASASSGDRDMGAPAPTQVAASNAEREEPVVMRVVHVQTDPGVLDRYRAAPPPLIVRVDDAALLETLEQFDRPTGLVRMGDDVFLTASVADEPANADRRNSL